MIGCTYTNTYCTFRVQQRGRPRRFSSGVSRESVYQSPPVAIDTVLVSGGAECGRARDLDGDGRQASETPDPDSTVVASHQANSHGTAASSTLPRYRFCTT
jgi:hypothetical protein